MEDVWCVAEDLAEMSLAGRSKSAILALAEQHREVIIFFAALTSEGFFETSQLEPIDIC